MRASRHLSRRNLGKKFSEGARQLWLVMIRRGWTQRDMKEALGLTEGTVPRLLFGDRRPEWNLAQLIHKALRISPGLWHEEPTREFEVPEVLPVPTAERKRWAA